MVDQIGAFETRYGRTLERAAFCLLPLLMVHLTIIKKTKQQALVSRQRPFLYRRGVPGEPEWEDQ
ncbi:MAG: hypothetical protein A2W26_10490 [Acidobacteria bacterium RBG_16_64_8]|nr:MAG: hypothetical protein A2W26_10490 [Acidobacteria bacterium RBG_16_64_8]